MKPPRILRRSTALWVSVGAVALVATGAGVGWAVSADNASSDAGDFVVPNVVLPTAATGATVTQPLAGLWFDSTPTSFKKVSGAGWLSVSKDGVVSGTAPVTAPGQPGTITVSGTDGAVSHTITVEVPVSSAGSMPRVEAASWNLDDAFASATGGAAEGMKQAVTQILANGIQVLGLQGTDGTAAAELAGDLGWYDYQSPVDVNGGDLGVVSAYPIVAGSQIAPTATTPAAAVTVSAHGTNVQVWTSDADGTDATFETQAGCSGATTAKLLLGGGATDVCGTTWTTLASEQLHAGWGNDDTGLLTETWPSSHAAAVTLYTTQGAAAGTAAPALIARAQVDRVSEGAPLTSPSTEAPTSTASTAPTTKPGTKHTTKLRSMKARTPRINGTVRVGHTLRAVTGGWSPKPHFSYQWYVGGRAVKGATHGTYTIKKSALGKVVRVKVTGTKSGYTTVSRTSARTRAVRKAAK